MGKSDKIPIKSAKDIELMKEACQVTAIILDELEGIIVPGINTEQINQYVHNRTIEQGATPSPLHYRGFPKSTCTSVNDIVCHGIPSPFVVLKSGDIINVDVTSFKGGFHGDSSRMYFVGGRDACSKKAQQLVDITLEALNVGIKEVAPGKRVGDIGAAIEAFIKNTGLGYGVVREYTGHGVGRQFHEPPTVTHFGRRGEGEELKEGYVFTIEPMINIGTWRTTLSRLDGWTVRTADGSLSAQWEHTVAVTKDGAEILTLSKTDRN